MSVSDNFLNHKISFWKQKSTIYVILFYAYIIELQSCDVGVCVALELCSRFLQNWFFFLNIFKRYLKVLKWGALQCNQVVVRNSCVCASFSFLLNQVYSKNGKTVYQQWFLSKLIWFIQCRLFLLGFSICLQDDAEFRCCLTY